MKRAHTITKRTGETMSDSMKAAWQLQKLNEMLREGVVNLVYYKKDGSVRKALATLRCGGYKGTSDTLSKVVVYYDLNKCAFRSFCVENLIGFEAR